MVLISCQGPLYFYFARAAPGSGGGEGGGGWVDTDHRFHKSVRMTLLKYFFVFFLKDSAARGGTKIVYTPSISTASA